MTGITADAFVALYHSFRIVHHVPGRLRVRLGKGTLPQLRGVSVGTFRQFIESIDGVIRFRISPATLSAVVEYDRELLSPSLWESLICGPDEEARLAFARLTGSIHKAEDNGSDRSFHG